MHNASLGNGQRAADLALAPALLRRALELALALLLAPLRICLRLCSVPRAFSVTFHELKASWHLIMSDRSTDNKAAHDVHVPQLCL